MKRHNGETNVKFGKNNKKHGIENTLQEPTSDWITSSPGISLLDSALDEHGITDLA